MKGYFIMKLSSSCKEAIDSCLATRSFAVAHLYNDEKPMKIHIHDCYEIYFPSPVESSFLSTTGFMILNREIFFLSINTKVIIFLRLTM